MLAKSMLVDEGHMAGSRAGQDRHVGHVGYGGHGRHHQLV